LTETWFRGITPHVGAPAEIDTGVAHNARIYDYWLGGKDNFAADREAGDRALEANPRILLGVRANRRFLARAVRYLAGEAGIRQFLDAGTGLPAMDNTHEVAQAVAPDARVVYVDNDHFKSGCAHARGRSGCLRRTRGAGKNHVTRCKRWGRQAGYEPAGADTAEPGMVVPGWMR
jgi:hypothetical protein